MDTKTERSVLLALLTLVVVAAVSVGSFRVVKPVSKVTFQECSNNATTKCGDAGVASFSFSENSRTGASSCSYACNLAPAPSPGN
jgi:hypothetical protein